MVRYGDIEKLPENLTRSGDVMHRKGNLRPVIGRSAGTLEINKMQIELLSDSALPLPVDVRVFEEDTRLVLTVDQVMCYVDEHPVRLMTRIMEEKPYTPGSVVPNRSSWYAVVLDLDADIPCRQEWIEAAYRELFRLAEERGVARLGIPLLGTVHGGYPVRDSLRIMVHQVGLLHPGKIKKIVILVRKGMEEETGKLLGQVMS